ncbi:helix-turn-helix transcriptional regulator [Flavobacterium sp.]|uniref:helix-turn-helix transcriptional regulator n=1 Tax=Flavobacterium sp. TaxID=239 RepID=UPI0039E55959
MTEERTIVIGCDCTGTLSVLLETLKRNRLQLLNAISVSRISDLISIAKSLDPALVIFAFRNNAAAVSDFNQFAKKPQTPLLCITRQFETGIVPFNDDHIIFTFPHENIRNADHFLSNVRSIFLLGKESSGAKTPHSFSGVYAHQISSDDRNISRYVLELDQKTEVLQQVKDRIKNLFARVDDGTRVELLSIVNAIKASAADNKIWDDFKLYFEKTNPNFLLSLIEKHPKLTPKDLKYCCYLKMNMSNDDIRNLLGINQESVRTHKYRLKKKMALDPDLDLQFYVNSIEILKPGFA